MDPMDQAEMIARWDEHIGYEFSTRDVSSTIATMVPDAYVNHVPVMTGGYGHEALRRFYKEDFISPMPADTSIQLVSRTLGQDQLVDEIIFSFTHTEEMPWMLPGIPPTHRHVDIPLVVVVGFRDGKLAHERIYWDQAQTNRPAHRSIASRIWSGDRAQAPRSSVALNSTCRLIRKQYPLLYTGRRTHPIYRAGFTKALGAKWSISS